MIRQRLERLGMEQRELARAAQVTESYISQLLTGRRLPPAPRRTDIYGKLEKALRLPRGELAALAAHQRLERVRREWGDEAPPLFGGVRELILRKCHPGRRRAIRAIVEREPFGEVERLVTHSILELVKRVTSERLQDERWLRTVAKLAGRSYQDVRVVALEFLDTDILHVSPANCVAFLEPLVASWDIDLRTFELAVTLSPKVSERPVRRFRFVELSEPRPPAPEPGYADFLADRALSASATEEEIAFLAALTFGPRQPTALLYYRVLQELRDPLHFGPKAGGKAMRKAASPVRS